MSIADFNRKRNIKWNINTEGFEYKKCSEMPLETDIIIYGLFVTPDRGYGKGAVAITKDCLLNLPSSTYEIVSAILENEQTIEDIKKAKCGIRISTYMSKFNRKGYNVEFIDL